MTTKLLVPRLGEGVDELTVVKWLKAEGDSVHELEPLLEVETDKVVTEIPSPASGILLRIEVGENTAVEVGRVLAWIGQPGELLAEAGPARPEAAAKVDPLPERTKSVAQREPVDRQPGFLSPVVRKIAAEHNLDLRQVRGSGLNGRITKQDVLAHLAGRPAAPVASGSDTEARGTLLPITTVRSQIAERMLASKQTSPHVMTVMEADLHRIAAHRAANKAAYEADGVNLTYTVYFMAAIAAALKVHPLANASWTDEGLLLHAEINIGMATSLGEQGLIVPVLQRVDELSLLGIARGVNDLAHRARTKRLRPFEVRGGTFTLTNHGIGGSLFAMPIINQPQCGILGTGAIQKRPVVVSDGAGNDALAIRPMVYLSFVFDHRILDGASADAFLSQVQERLENWSA
ncbi:MAG: 2-oxo acid dehydrogenase subunit E2 [Anaerolineales bacterium]|nr:2-oxo acid dehydrogenase subunit E2 [Anaerolineales bacterium]